MKNEAFYKYMNTLNDVQTTVDFARMRAYELKGAASQAEPEEADQRSRQLKASINLEIKHLETTLLDLITQLENIKNSTELVYEFTKNK